MEPLNVVEGTGQGRGGRGLGFIAISLAPSTKRGLTNEFKKGPRLHLCEKDHGDLGKTQIRKSERETSISPLCGSFRGLSEGKKWKKRE